MSKSSAVVDMANDEGDFSINCDIIDLIEESDGVFQVKIHGKDISTVREACEMNKEDLRELQDENFAFIKKQKSAATVRKTEKHKDRFIEFLRDRNEHRMPEEIEPVELDVYLGNFVKKVQKLDGNDYEPDSVTSIYGSIDRYLREKHYSTSIQESGIFKNSREMLEAKRKMLKASGLGNKPNKAIALSKDELEQLWERGGFGTSTPEQLTATIWYVLSLHFGFRACHESRQLKMGDIIVQRDSKGDKYLDALFVYMKITMRGSLRKCWLMECLSTYRSTI